MLKLIHVAALVGTGHLWFILTLVFGLGALDV